MGLSTSLAYLLSSKIASERRKLNILHSDERGISNSKRSNTETSDTSKPYRNISIAQIFSLVKNRNINIARVVFLIALLGYWGFSVWIDTSLNIYVVSILLACLMLTVIEEFVLHYRIKKGLYGNNLFEAKEIVSFVISESDRIDFHDDGHPKKLLDPISHLDEQTIEAYNLADLRLSPR